MARHILIELFVVGISTLAAYFIVLPKIKERWPWIGKILIVLIMIGVFLFFQLYFFFTQKRLEDDMANIIGEAICRIYTVDACPPEIRAWSASQKTEKQKREAEKQKAKSTRQAQEAAQRAGEFARKAAEEVRRKAEQEAKLRADEEVRRKGEQETVGLAPSAFRLLPSAVAAELSKRGCSIPQVPRPWSSGLDTPHNVISGEFQKPGQADWAVLCSVAGRSLILVFWNGSAENVEEVSGSMFEDRYYLRPVGDGTVGFRRAINAVGKEYIFDHYRFYGGPKPPSIDHEGINDILTEISSRVRYWHEGTWLKLTGAD